MHIYLCYREKNTDSEKTVRQFLKDYSRDAALGFSDDVADNAIIAYGRHGKPFFADLPQVHFSVSHSGSYFACAFDRSPLGMDIEHISIRRDCDEKRWEKIARRFFTHTEYEYVLNGGKESFLQIWVRKEAYLKFTRTGIASGLARINFVNENKLLGKVENAFVKGIDLYPENIAACCSSNEPVIEKIHFKSSRVCS